MLFTNLASLAVGFAMYGIILILPEMVQFPTQTLVRSVAEHIAAVGRLPLVHALAISEPPPAVDVASAVRAKDLLYRTALVPGVSFTGPVLLVDNTIRTRWTATVAAALLADAGATSVLALAIHQLP